MQNCRIARTYLFYDMFGFFVEFRKNIYTLKYLKSLDLSERLINAVLYVKEKGKITNSDYQKLNNCSRNTASTDLMELVKIDVLKASGQKGAGAFYTF
jgi:ATP-dependent DNA helicase RecG